MPSPINKFTLYWQIAELGMIDVRRIMILPLIHEYPCTTDIDRKSSMISVAKITFIISVYEFKVVKVNKKSRSLNFGHTQ